jgi:signal transduction histidine kinase
MKALSRFGRTTPVSGSRANLAVRLALVYGLVSLITVMLMGLAIYVLTARYLTLQADEGLSALAEFYASYAAATTPDQEYLTALAPQIASAFAPQSDYEVRIFSARNGALLASTRDIGPLPSSAALAELRRRQPTLFLAASNDLPERLYAARPVPSAQGTTMAVVEVSRHVGEMRTFQGTLRLVLVVAGGLALAAALLASLLLARQMTRPLRQMESATQAIAGGDFGRRLRIVSNDEIGRLAASINQMAEDLGHLESARRDFIARISHDLRTPLTAIKGLVVNLQDAAPAELQPSLATVDEQTDRLIRLVNDLLITSRLQRGLLRFQRVHVDLAEVARAAVSLASEKAKRAGIVIALDSPDSLPAVLGDADRLQQVTVNLLDNALRATPTGGQIDVRITASEDEIELTVSDTGRGLTAEEAARAFEPYFRGAGGGAGLGLTIAREIVEAHSGRIWLQARTDGGTEAGFALPLA